MADEILFQARVHPGKRVGELTEGEREGVWREMKSVVGKACEVDANHAKFPKGGWRTLIVVAVGMEG